MQKIQIFGVPMDLGQQRRGVDMGPSAVRYAGLYDKLERLGLAVEDAGNVQVPVRDERAVRAEIEAGSADENLLHLSSVVAACKAIYKKAKSASNDRDNENKAEVSIFLGGDHSIAIGTVGGAAARAKDEALGLIWIDAHGDFNTPETSPSGNIHGMPVAVLTGEGRSELVNLGHDGAKLAHQNIVMIGIRDLDQAEKVALAQTGINIYTMRDVDELGMATVARRSLQHLQHLNHIHVSLDMDSIDPVLAPGVGTPVPGGLSFREAHLLMEILAESNKIRSMDVVEVNPILDEGNCTAELAVELIASIFGQRIL